MYIIIIIIYLRDDDHICAFRLFLFFMLVTTKFDLKGFLTEKKKEET